MEAKFDQMQKRNHLLDGSLPAKLTVVGVRGRKQKVETSLVKSLTKYSSLKDLLGRKDMDTAIETRQTFDRHQRKSQGNEILLFFYFIHRYLQAWTTLCKFLQQYIHVAKHEQVFL